MLEEVDSNHIPESVKDMVVKVLISRKEVWEPLFYTLLQNDSDSSNLSSSLVPLSYKEQIIQCLTFSLFCCSLPDLYSFPSESHPESCFLSLLLQLALSNPHSLLRHSILTLLMRLFELGSYPVHRLFDACVKLVYEMVMTLCGAMLRNELDAEEMLSLIHLLTTMIREARSILTVNKAMNLDVVRVLLGITSNPSQDVASLTMESWNILTVRCLMVVSPEGNGELLRPESGDREHLVCDDAPSPPPQPARQLRVRLLLFRDRL